MSNTQLLSSFFLIAVVVSVALAYLGAAISTWTGLQASFANLLLAPLMLAPFYAIFVLIGGSVFGVPALIALRKLGLTQNRISFASSGLLVGAVSGALLLGSWIGFAGLPLGIGFGATAGLLASLLWFQMVESKLRNG